MDWNEFLWLLQERRASGAVGPSTLRNTGASGVVDAARKALGQVELERFVVTSEAEFARELDRATKKIQRRLPHPANRWGNARKALNIFLRDIVYDTYLAGEYKFRRLERWLELPLDSYTSAALLDEEAGAELPRWPGVAKATPEIYAQYQAIATRVARECGIGARVHLDVFWWRR